MPSSWRASFALDEGENPLSLSLPLLHRFPYYRKSSFSNNATEALHAHLSPLTLPPPLSLSLLPFLHLFLRRTRQAKFQVAITRVRNLTFDVSVEFLTAALFNGRYRAALCHGVLWDRQRKIGIIGGGTRRSTYAEAGREAGIPVE